MMQPTPILQAFEQQFGAPAQWLIRAPGRVNLIGEHTDYNDGFVLPCAIDFSNWVAVRRNGALVNRVAAQNYGARDEWPVGEHAPSSHDWGQYVRGTVWALSAQGFRQPEGVDMLIGGDIPQGAGLSSSAALEVGVAKALQSVFGWPLDNVSLAQIAQHAENAFVGCQCGIMDQLASACGLPGQALLLDCRSLDFEPIRIPEHLRVMIVHSHVKRALVGSEYNVRREQCQAAAAYFQAASLRDVTMQQWRAEHAGLEPLLARRAHYIIAENERTQAAAHALRTANLPQLSRLMAESHAGMRDEFDITHPAVDKLVDILQNVLGEAGGARMTGGGFGGCVVALLPQECIEPAKEALAKHYHAATGLKEEVFVCAPEAGVQAFEAA